MAQEGERWRKREAGLLATRMEVLFPQKQFLLIARKKKTEYPAPLLSCQKKPLWPLVTAPTQLPAWLLPTLWLGGKQPFRKDARPSKKGSERCLSVINGLDMPKMSAPWLPGSGSGELSQAPWATAGRS